jgi:hypothetical protein
MNRTGLGLKCLIAAAFFVCLIVENAGAQVPTPTTVAIPSQLSAANLSGFNQCFYLPVSVNSQVYFALTPNGGTATVTIPAVELVATNGCPPLAFPGVNTSVNLTEHTLTAYRLMQWNGANPTAGITIDYIGGQLSEVDLAAGVLTSLPPPFPPAVSLVAFYFAPTSSTNTTAAIQLSGTAFPQTEFTTLPADSSLLGSPVPPLALVVTCIDAVTKAIVPDCDVLVSLKSVPFSGGHDHHDADRPVGAFLQATSVVGLNPVAGNTGSAGFDTLYDPPEISGDVAGQITGTANGAAIVPASFTIHVNVPNLEQLAAGVGNTGGLCTSNYALTGAPPNKSGSMHQLNHFGKHILVSAIPRIASVYCTDPEGGGTLGINDMSLPVGGILDIRNNWLAVPLPNGHSLHRTGNSVDIDHAHVDDGTPINLAFLKALFDYVGYHQITKDPNIHFERNP